MLKFILISIGLVIVIVVWYGVQLDYKDFRARDRESGYAEPDWSYREAVVRVVKQLLRLK